MTDIRLPYIDANNRARETRLVDVVAFIDHHVTTLGYSPSISDVVNHTGVASKDTIHRDLEVLRHRGWITQAPRIARTMRVTDLGRAVLQVDRTDSST